MSILTIVIVGLTETEAEPLMERTGSCACVKRVIKRNDTSMIRFMG